MESVLSKVPLNPPARGRETIQAIYDQITIHPETHDQKDWENQFGCKTTRCIAGWAEYLHRGEVSTGGDMRFAREVMGIDYPTGDRIFMDCNEAQAVAALKMLLDNGEINWPEVWDIQE